MGLWRSTEILYCSLILVSTVQPLFWFHSASVSGGLCFTLTCFKSVPSCLLVWFWPSLLLNWAFSLPFWIPHLAFVFLQSWVYIWVLPLCPHSISSVLTMFLGCFSVHITAVHASGLSCFMLHAWSCVCPGIAAVSSYQLIAILRTVTWGHLLIDCSSSQKDPHYSQVTSLAPVSMIYGQLPLKLIFSTVEKALHAT